MRLLPKAYCDFISENVNTCQMAFGFSVHVQNIYSNHIVELMVSKCNRSKLATYLQKRR